MTIFVRGIGWLTETGYGCIGKGVNHVLGKGEGLDSLAKKEIFSHTFKNFGRLDVISRMTAYAVALALRDADMECSPEKKQDIGIVGTGSEGSLRSDIGYFKDYIEGGRTLSRGNLFIYTLPSSPLGEAAIHFGLLGPLLYATSREHALSAVMDMAGSIVLTQETEMMLAGKAEADEALYFVFGRGGKGTSLCSIDEARSIVEPEQNVDGMVRKFFSLTRRSHVHVAP